jgi:ketosteroid isomerase-like protein
MSEPVPGPGFDSAEAAEEAFYAAFRALDIKAMARVWSDGEGTVCVHPGGAPLVGKAATLRAWAEIFSGAAPPRLDHRRLNRIASADLAVHLVEESIRVGRAPAGEPNLVLATNVLVRGADGWRLAAHHASLPLMPEPRADEPPRRLH